MHVINNLMRQLINSCVHFDRSSPVLRTNKNQTNPNRTESNGRICVSSIMSHIDIAKVRRFRLNCLCLSDYIRTTKYWIKREHFDIIASFILLVCVCVLLLLIRLLCIVQRWLPTNASINPLILNSSNCNWVHNSEQYQILLESIKFTLKINPVQRVEKISNSNAFSKMVFDIFSLEIRMLLILIKVNKT